MPQSILDYGDDVLQAFNLVPQAALNNSVYQAANGDISPSTIIKGVTSLDYTGVCGQYKTDAEHNMTHTAWIVSLKGSVATKTLVKTYTNMASS